MNRQISLFKKEDKFNSFYVYILINSLNNEVFYVGKGSKNRKDQHLIEFNKIINYQEGKIKSFKEINDKRKYRNYKKMRLFFEIYSNGGEVISKIIYGNLSEKKSFKIEQLIIFILKRKIEYLCIHKEKGKRKKYLRKFGGKLINKSIGGESPGKKTVNEFTNPSMIIENHNEISSIVENSEFINDLRKKKYSNFTEIENYSTVSEYLFHQNEIILNEIIEFKK